MSARFLFVSLENSTLLSAIRPFDLLCDVHKVSKEDTLETDKLLYVKG